MRKILVLVCVFHAGAYSDSDRRAFAQDSAPSSHMVFDDNFDGDVVINEVRVPQDGAAMYTYYEALGWRGRGAGYAGIQVHPRAPNFIFSIWDHKEHTAPIKAVYHSPGTETQGFGGEGTGLKSWNFKLGWKTGVWYTLVARNWPVGDHTHYAFWARAGDTKVWTHLVTMDVGTKEAKFKGGTDAFIEDWSRTGAKPRTTHLRNGWKRKTDGTWHSFQQARYSVNSWDLTKGKRSFNYRANWNGGVGEDETGKFYFMTAGGEKTTATAKNPSMHSINRKEQSPPFTPARFADVQLLRQPNNKLVVRWTMDSTSAPMFAYQVQVYDNADLKGTPLLTESQRVAHARNVTLDLTGIGSEKSPRFVKIWCTDILDRESKAVVKKMPRKSS